MQNQKNWLSWRCSFVCKRNVWLSIFGFYRHTIAAYVLRLLTIFGSILNFRMKTKWQRWRISNRPHFSLSALRSKIWANDDGVVIVDDGICFVCNFKVKIRSSRQSTQAVRMFRFAAAGGYGLNTLYSHCRLTEWITYDCILSQAQYKDCASDFFLFRFVILYFGASASVPVRQPTNLSFSQFKI